MKRFKKFTSKSCPLIFAAWLGLVSPLCVLSQQASTGALYPIYHKGKWGYSDRDGRIVIQPQFVAANPFVNGMAEVWRKENGLKQFIDARGNVIADRNFSSDHFSEGLIPVKIENKYGFADMQGKIIIFPQFDAAKDFSAGLAPVQLNKKWGYIDHEGRFIIEPQFDNADSFAEGLAAVGIAKQPASTEKQGSIDEILASNKPLQSLYRYGFINLRGEFVVEPKYDLAGSFSEGLAAVNTGGYNDIFGSVGAARWGYIDKTGKVVIELKFNGAGAFSEGLAPVRVGKKYGYIDESGKVVIAPQFESAFEFQDGLAFAQVGRRTYGFKHSVVTITFHGKSGYIDKTGRFVSDKLTWHT
ncbi:MAG: WG repeat-containing protein [Acidobacteria bacterium]|nr:WG repeat-containing protein [Acidobacteriota bacterium]